MTLWSAAPTGRPVQKDRVLSTVPFTKDRRRLSTTSPTPKTVRKAYPFNASAPPMISMSSLVIAA
jgi:hypothetical protein